MKKKPIFLAIFISQFALALEPIRFGPEFSFSPSPNIPYNNLSVGKRMIQHLVDEQPEGAKFKVTIGNEYEKSRETLTSPNGWWFAWYPDGGVEVNMKPMTVAEYKQYASDMQDAIFASAASVGYFPELWRGGGHINIDTTNFEKNPWFFRNFLVDFLNHNELVMGIFNYDTNNASPFQFTPEKQIVEAIAIMDESLRSGNTDLMAMVRRLKEKIYGGSIYLSKISERRLEIRAVRPQQSLDVWIRQIELLEARMKYVATFPVLIPYKPQVPFLDERLRNKYVPPIEPQAALRAFYVYVTESRQPWKNHRDYLWPQWMWRQKEDEPSELEKFESSPWFKIRQARSHCERFLGATSW